ncbi:thiol-activated cytolysin [Aquimarina sp. MAR_2010_214]|uniref:thiol-activated cytolysin family protein n=1 Tax=Aquimarina sp. MAR_2010_214 TaxID=1250026 RepID=UPI000C70B56E|nr:thiol-activated cytolysin family protein [Aquimarina sp. MAR_2010_214]PKV52268.1 thiol-activated cytolysin [Aquimarina sp. MAR_2010_214]
MKILKTYLLKKTILLFLTGIIISCSNDDKEPTDPIIEPTTFAEVISIGGEFEDFPKSRKTDIIKESAPVNEDREGQNGNITATERFVCTTKTLSVLDGNGQFPLFNSSADVIYPGSLLQGKTLSNVTPSPIVVKRAGGTISYNLNNGNLQSTFSVDQVKKSTIQEGMNTIISNAGEVVPANFQLDIIQVESQSQMALEMGLTVEGYGARAEANMSFSSEKQYNRTLVKMSQSYYTMSFDLPTSPAEIFDGSVTPDQLRTYVQEDNPATFISSVTYGRIFYMLVESTSSRQEMEASLNLAYDGFGVNAGGNLNVNAFSALKNLKIKVIAYGGDAAGTFELTGETSIGAIANKLAESTDIRAGLPLSYVVRSAERPDQIVGTKLATEYDVVECKLKGTLPTANYAPLVDIFEDGIGAAVHISGSNIVLYNKAGNKYVYYNVSNANILGTFDLNDPNGPMGITALPNVGAGIRAADDVIYLFDQTGIKMQHYNYESKKFSANTLPNGPIGIYRNTIASVTDIFGFITQFPFTGDGYDAAARFVEDFDILPGLKYPRQIYFSTNGSQFAEFIRFSKQWGKIRSTNEWDTPAGKLFDKVGAATRIDFGSGKTKQMLFVNFDGDQIMTWNLTDGARGVLKGPWVIN